MQKKVWQQHWEPHAWLTQENTDTDFQISVHIPGVLICTH